MALDNFMRFIGKETPAQVETSRELVSRQKDDFEVQMLFREEIANCEEEKLEINKRTTQEGSKL